MPTDPLNALRAACVALPEVTETVSHGAPTFWVAGKKTFAIFARPESHHGGGRPAVWIKSTPDNQAWLLEAHGDRVFKPPYVGPGGWIGIWLDRRPSWRLVRELLADGHRLAAPPRLRAQLHTQP
jgi:predicted DNA-binding protein (MmcQ/YjbR family)